MGMSKGEYDFRRFDHVWQRVAPGVNPWEGGDPPSGAESAKPDHAALSGMADDSGRTALAGTAALVRGADCSSVRSGVPTLPGAVEPPCCLGAEGDQELLADFIEEELSQRRQFLALARLCPGWARQKLRDLAAGNAKRGRRLMAVWYLITGEAYCPAVCVEGIRVGPWCPALREQYHDAACTALRYAKAAESTADPCLGRLLEDLSSGATQQAEEILRLLERAIAS